MDNVNYSLKMTPALERAGLFASHPFTLIDVGCSGGLDPIWRTFGSGLRAFGFDPNRGECERLQRSEKNPAVRYFPMAVGLPEDHEFRRRKAACDAARTPYETSLFVRSSAWNLRRAIHPPAPASAQPEPAATPEPPARIGLADFFRQQNLEDVDFVKIDTDGGDLEVLHSVESAIDSHRILGFMVECNFHGSDHETSNTLHNIDRFLKRHGFMLYGMSINRYSRAVLPAPFVYNLAAQTEWGQPTWGDIVFLRDLAGPEFGVPAESFATDKILKLACLYEIFRVPDCAAELLLRFAERVATVIDPGGLLDLLTPPLRRKELPYRKYVQTVTEDPGKLLP